MSRPDVLFTEFIYTPKSLPSVLPCLVSDFIIPTESLHPVSASSPLHGRAIRQGAPYRHTASRRTQPFRIRLVTVPLTGTRTNYKRSLQCFERRRRNRESFLSAYSEKTFRNRKRVAGVWRRVLPSLKREEKKKHHHDPVCAYSSIFSYLRIYFTYK